MDIYLVRHGETDGNVAVRHQHPDTPLNEVGLRQAHEVAQKLQKYRPNYLISSKQKRALTTAAIISEYFDLVPVSSDDYIELVRPNYLIGERRYGIKMLVYMFLWYLGYGPASRHDGETYVDFLTRIERAKVHLSSLPADSRVVIVSHAGFIAFFLAHLNYSNKISPFRALYVFVRMFFIQNTQITHITYENKKWSIKRR